jgi:Tfp pilus assembly protein PilO
MLKRMRIGLACCAVLVLVVCGFIYCNGAGKLDVLQKEQSKKQEQLDNSQKIADRLPVARREFLDAQAKLGFLEQGVSSKVYVPTFLRQIEELGRKNHLKVVGIRPKPAETKPLPTRPPDTGKDEKVVKAKPAPPEPYDKLDLDIEVTGKYWDVVRLMFDITSFPKIVAVNDIQVSPVGIPCRSVSPPLSIKFNATAFILKQQPAAAEKGVKSAKVLAEAQNGDKG